MWLSADNGCILLPNLIRICEGLYTDIPAVDGVATMHDAPDMASDVRQAA